MSSSTPRTNGTRPPEGSEDANSPHNHGSSFLPEGFCRGYNYSGRSVFFSRLSSRIQIFRKRVGLL